MTTPLRLIKDVTPVIPGMPARGRQPNIGVVYATAGGRLGSYPDWRPMTYREQFRTAYRRRYDVDMSHHRRRALMMSTPLPSRGDYYFFIADVEVGFRVHDPEEIVRRNLNDGNRVVYAHLADEFRKITRKYDIEDSELAETEIVSRFDVDDILPDGITVFYVAPRLRPDEKASRYLQDKKEAERRVHVARVEHQVALQSARQRGELDRMNREFEREMAELEFRRLEGRALDAYEIVRHHLARHPEDTEGALDLIVKHRRAWMEHQEQYNKRTADLFQSMVDSKLVQAADMEKLLPQMLSQLGIVPTPVPVEATVGSDWSEPPVFAAAEDPVGVSPPPAGVQPVYLVLDESAQAEEVLPHVSDELPGMLTAIAGDAAAPGIRLAVLGYDRHVTELMPLGAVNAAARTPRLTAGDTAAYAVLFAALGDRIDADLAAVPAGQQVNTPMVYVLCASTADDNWTVARHRLTDPDLHPRPPEIMAFGVGDAPPDLVAGIASDSSEAFLAAPGSDPAAAIQHFAEFVVHDVLKRAGQPDRDHNGPPPDGFSPAGQAP